MLVESIDYKASCELVELENQKLDKKHTTALLLTETNRKGSDLIARFGDDGESGR